MQTSCSDPRVKPDVYLFTITYGPNGAFFQAKALFPKSHAKHRRGLDQYEIQKKTYLGSNELCTACGGVNVLVDAQVFSKFNNVMDKGCVALQKIRLSSAKKSD